MGRGLVNPMPDTPPPLPSREKWNTPHSLETAWDIAAEMSSYERRLIAAAWLSESLVIVDEGQRKQNIELSNWEVERGL